MHQIVCKSCGSNFYFNDSINIITSNHLYRKGKILVKTENYNFISDESCKYENSVKSYKGIHCPKCKFPLASLGQKEGLQFDLKINEILSFPFLLIETEPHFFESFIQIDDHFVPFAKSKIGKILNRYYSIKAQKIIV